MESLFSVGDKIICVDSSSTGGNIVGLIEGKTYIVSGIRKTTCCGKHIEVDVGLYSQKSHTYCRECGGLVPSGLKAWKLQTRFIKPDTDQALSDQITEALNEDLKVKL